MNQASPFTPAERLESLKAALCGAICAGLLSLAQLLSHRWPSLTSLPPLRDLFSSLAGLTLLVTGAIALLSGALFALTYRYAIRRDDNPQLKAGVVLAFALVRGLAQVDAGSAIAQNFWPFLAACGESLVLFGGCAIALNLALRWQWLQPFGEK
ncbi:MAG: hypothetical protein AAF773_26045 [Cyanobacteria bacterium P01_D01_bin.115]